MKLKVNGNNYECAEGTSLAALVQNLKLDESALVAEHNGAVVASAAFPQVILHADDRVELIEFVAGG